MKATFFLNRQKVGYLIHGQVFQMQYSISACLFVLIYSKRNGLKIRRSIGCFNGLSDAYAPNLTFWAFGLGIKKYQHCLKVNFINTKLTEMETGYQLPKYKIQVATKRRALFLTSIIERPKPASVPNLNYTLPKINNSNSQLIYNQVKNEYNKL